MSLGKKLLELLQDAPEVVGPSTEDLIDYFEARLQKPVERLRSTIDFTYTIQLGDLARLAVNKHHTTSLTVSQQSLNFMTVLPRFIRRDLTEEIAALPSEVRLDAIVKALINLIKTQYPGDEGDLYADSIFLYDDGFGVKIVIALDVNRYFDFDTNRPKLDYLRKAEDEADIHLTADKTGFVVTVG